jgi:hypothetical protein
MKIKRNDGNVVSMRIKKEGFMKVVLVKALGFWQVQYRWSSL